MTPGNSTKWGRGGWRGERPYWLKICWERSPLPYVGRRPEIYSLDCIKWRMYKLEDTKHTCWSWSLGRGWVSAGILNVENPSLLFHPNPEFWSPRLIPSGQEMRNSFFEESECEEGLKIRTLGASSPIAQLCLPAGKPRGRKFHEHKQSFLGFH